MPHDYDIIERTLAYAGYFRITRFRLRHALFAGGQTPELVRERFERGHAVGVLPYDPWQDQVVLIEQFRIGAVDSGFGPWLLETVAGIIEPGESPNEVAHRETHEETGGVIGELEPIAHYLASPGGSSHSVQLYCAPIDSRALQRDGHGLEHEGEDIRVHVLPTDQALDLLRSGGVHAAMPIIALQWLALNRVHLQARWQDARQDLYSGPGLMP